MNHSPILPTDADYVFWNVRNITGNDFQGPIEQVEDTIARTYCTMQLDWDEEIFQNGSIYQFKIVKIKIDAIFGRKKSWAKKEFFENSIDGVPKMLNHEQGHFDLCEECSRQLNEKTMHLEGKDFECKGNNEEERKTFAHDEATRIMREIYDPESAKLSRLHKEYDNETNHGWIPAQQRIWDERFQKLCGK